MMKKLLFLLTMVFITLIGYSQDRAIIQAVADGNWNSASTWDAGIPGTSDDVIIAGYTVTSTTSADVAGSITVGSTATLTINSGATLTTSGDVIVSGILNQNGTFNTGDAVGDKLNINGGTFNVGNGSTTTVSGYYKQEWFDASHVGTIAATSGTTATINVANAGALNDNTNNIFYFGDDCVSSLTGCTINVNVLHGNSGTADEVFIGIATGVNPGNGTFTLGNGSNTVSAWSMVNNSSFGYVKLDIGSGNTLSFSNTVDRTTNTVIFYGLNVTSGTFYIEPGSGLKITNNNALIVGASGALELGADATGTGELIYYDDADDVEATIGRYITGQEYHFISPSTTNATTADVFQGYNPNIWLLEWEESTQSWFFIDQVIDPDLTYPLNVGQGYSIYGEQLSRVDDYTISTTGDMRSSDFVVSESLGSDEFTLVGNPFSTTTRVIYAGSLGPDNTGFYDEIWVWDGANAQYRTYVGGAGGGVPNGEVAQGQAFFVRSLNGWSGNATFTMYEDQRRFGPSDNFYKSSGNIDWNDNYGIGDYVMLKVTDGDHQDGIFVNFGDEGTTGIENGYDGFKRFGAETSPQLYLVENDNNLSIDYLKTLEEGQERIVSMNFKAGKDGEHTIAANLDSLMNTQVTLEDTKTNTMHEFNIDQYYTFNASVNDSPDRFLLHFMYNPTGIEDPADAESGSLNIYAYNKNVYISSNDANIVESTVQMFDLLGRQVYSDKIELGSYNRIPVNVSNTYLIVKVIKGNEVVTQKVFIK